MSFGTPEAMSRYLAGDPSVGDGLVEFLHELRLGEMMAVRNILSMTQAAAQEAMARLSPEYPAVRYLQALLSGPRERRVDCLNVLRPLIDDEISSLKEMSALVPSIQVYFDGVLPAWEASGSSGKT